MGESSLYQSASSRLDVKGMVGEIVEVQRGHIVRSTGRKDRHSRVCTAKGPRDRRVRLAAHTAIQFYDVQDRLGYDRPSKAVDWLIKKAKVAIDELAQLPTWHPTNCSAPTASFESENSQQKLLEEQQQQERSHQANLMNSSVFGCSTKRAMTVVMGGQDEQQDLHHRGIANNSNPQISSLLPPSLDYDVIADTFKSFPMGAIDEANSLAMQFPSFLTPGLMPRSSNRRQDFRISLQSFEDPILLHHQPHQQQHSPSPQPEQTHLQALVQGQVLLSGTPLGFDGAAVWPEHRQFQRFTAWSAGGDMTSGSGGAASSVGYFFNSPPAPQPLQQQLLGHNQLFSQRGSLQSSNTSSIRAWIDPSTVAMSTVDYGQRQPHHHPRVVPVYPPSVSGVGFASGYGGFTGFRIPARIQGDEEEHDGYCYKPSSASSDSYRRV